MEIKVKKCPLSKSKIQQMDYLGVPKTQEYEVLGWVNMDKKKWVIVKIKENYYRAEFLTKVDLGHQSFQFSIPGGGYEFPELHYSIVSSFNRGGIGYSADRDDSKNLEFYNSLLEFREKTLAAGQIYY